MQHDLQSDQQELGRQRDSLDADRKEVTQARERVPLLATALQGLAGLLLCGTALAVCVYLLRGLSNDTGAEELEDLLVLEVAGESQLFSPPPMGSLPSTSYCHGISSSSDLVFRKYGGRTFDENSSRSSSGRRSRTRG